jgi:protein O-mannosyl-transferase
MKTHAPTNPPAGFSRISAPVAALIGHPLGAAVLLVLAGVVTYANTLGVPFVLDDWSSIEAKPILRDLGAFLRSELLRGNRSVADLTFALNLAAHGIEVTGYHLVNGLIHVANGLLVYQLISITFEAPFLADVRTARGVSLAAALLFVVHPVQTQAVTYIAQRYASLSTFFVLAALVLYSEWRRRGPTRRRWGSWLAALASTVLAMRTKEIAFTLPMVLLLYEALFYDGDRRRRLVALIPFLATMLVIPLTILSTSGLAGASGVDSFASRTLGADEISRADYFLTQLRVIPTYLRLLVLPVDQTIDYDYPVEHAFVAPAVLVSFFALLGLAAAGLALIVRSTRSDPRLRVAGFGIGWFFVTLSVESSVIPSTTSSSSTDSTCRRSASRWSCRPASPSCGTVPRRGEAAGVGRSSPASRPGSSRSQPRPSPGTRSGPIP